MFQPPGGQLVGDLTAYPCDDAGAGGQLPGGIGIFRKSAHLGHQKCQVVVQGLLQKFCQNAATDFRDRAAAFSASSRAFSHHGQSAGAERIRAPLP